MMEPASLTMELILVRLMQSMLDLVWRHVDEEQRIIVFKILSAWAGSMELQLGEAAIPPMPRTGLRGA